MSTTAAFLLVFLGSCTIFNDCELTYNMGLEAAARISSASSWGQIAAAPGSELGSPRP